MNPTYLTEETVGDINEQLTEESEVLLPGFLNEDIYKSLCTAIVESDVSSKIFSSAGPPNLKSYEKALIGPPEKIDIAKESTDALSNIHKFFYSQEFFEFLEKLTEFPFTSDEKLIHVKSELRKFSHGSYTLLQSGGEKQTGNVLVSNGKSAAKNDDQDDELEPNLVDVIFFCSSNWDEERGGLTIYSANDGVQLITIPPEGNSLAITVRAENVNSYVNYVNYLAGEEMYFAYTMTFEFTDHVLVTND